MKTQLSITAGVLLLVSLCSCTDSFNPKPSMGNPVGKWVLLSCRDTVEFKSDGTVTRVDSGPLNPTDEPDPFSPLKRGASARWEVQGDQLTFTTKDADGKPKRKTFEYSTGTRWDGLPALSIAEKQGSKEIHAWILGTATAQPAVGGDGKPAPQP